MIDYFPSLATYYFGHLNVHKERIAIILVEERSLAPVTLESTASMAEYLRPILGNDPIVSNSMCYYVVDEDWLAIGFSILDHEEKERNVLYLSRTGPTLNLPMALRPGDNVVGAYSIH